MRYQEISSAQRMARKREWKKVKAVKSLPLENRNEILEILRSEMKAMDLAPGLEIKRKAFCSSAA